MNYAIIGCGLIGEKRLVGLPADSKLVVACDTNLSRAEKLVKLANAGWAVADFNAAVGDPQVNAVIVAVINAALAEASSLVGVQRRVTNSCPFTYTESGVSCTTGTSLS